MAKDYIAAITIGTDNIIGIVGAKEPNKLTVVAYVKEPSNGCIKRGVVTNIDKTADCIRLIKDKLNEQLYDNNLGEISKVYISYGGQSVRTCKNSVSKTFNSTTKIDSAIVDSMIEASKNVTYPNAEVLRVIAQEYKVDSVQTTEPVGTEGKYISCEYKNIIANPRLIEKIKISFDMAGLKIAGKRINHIVLGDALLTNEEKRAGCVFIDFGAETTTVSIYRNNILRYIAVIPLGSNTINSDLDNSEQIDNDNANYYKMTSAYAISNISGEQSNNNEDDIKLNGKVYNAKKLASIVEARIYEILLNVNHQIKLSGYKISDLFGGIIITGQGAKLRNLITAINTYICIKVRIAYDQENQCNLFSTSQDFINDINEKSNFTTPAIALITADSSCENCLYEAPEKAYNEEENNNVVVNDNDDDTIKPIDDSISAEGTTTIDFGTEDDDIKFDNGVQEDSTKQENIANEVSKAETTVLETPAENATTAASIAEQEKPSESKAPELPKEKENITNDVVTVEDDNSTKEKSSDNESKGNVRPSKNSNFIGILKDLKNKTHQIGETITNAVTDEVPDDDNK